ncbi:MAG: HEAT repeat domain-containing protein [Bacteroidales bacterium]
MRKPDCSLKYVIVNVLLLLAIAPLLYSQERGVFRVQVASTKIQYSAERISSDLRIREPLAIHFVDGRYKYFVGTFDSEAEALGHLKQVGVEGAYVVELPKGLENLADTTRKIEPDSLAAEPAKEDTTGVAATDSIPAADVTAPPAQEVAAMEKEESAPTMLIYLAIALAALALLVFAVLLIARWLRKSSARRKEKARYRVKERLAEALLEQGQGEEGLPTGGMTHLEKQLLIEEIMKLYPNLSGEIGNKMRELYIGSGLRNESASKLQSLDWKVRAEGFRELAVLNVPVAIEEIERCLNSNNMILRTEARLALIRLDREDPWCFLSRMKKPFTEWEQLQVYELLHGGGVAVPDFGRWLDAANESVVIFCIRMARAFDQDESYRKLIPLLYHENPEIRKEVVMALGHFRKTESLPLLIERYGIENQENRIQVIQSIARIRSEDAANFLRGILDPEEELRIEAAEALAGLESVGLDGIEEILRKSEERLQAVGRHLLTKRLNEDSRNPTGTP